MPNFNHLPGDSSEPNDSSTVKQTAPPAESLPFHSVVAPTPVADETLTVDIAQCCRIEPASIPSGVRLTITDGAWQPITLTREGMLLCAEVQLDLTTYSSDQRREDFLVALSDAAFSLEYEAKIAMATVDAAEDCQHVVIRWKQPFNPAVTLEKTVKKIRFHWDALFSRAEKSLGTERR